MTLLGVNIDHVATVRNARGGSEPDPLQAALIAERAGADSIVCHLREDRRHIRDDDVRRLHNGVKTTLQLEMSAAPEIVRFALRLKPIEAMLVPERRQEVTTEGGLDCVRHAVALKNVVGKLRAAGVSVSVFVDAEPDQVTAAAGLGAHVVELHTGPYAHAKGKAATRELARLAKAMQVGQDNDLTVHAGHGLNYVNIGALLRHVPVEKVNIGHSIVSRAVFAGMDAAVREMKSLIAGARA